MQYLMKYTNVLHHGRGPLVTDIILDSMGALLGILIVMLAIKIYENIKTKNNKDLKNMTKNNKKSQNVTNKS